MPIERVVVDGHLAVEAHDLTGRSDHQRVDLAERRVAVAIEAPESADDAGQRLLRRRPVRAGKLGIESRCGHDVAHLVVAEAEQGVDRGAHEGAGVAPRDLLDVHAALGREDQHRPTLRPRGRDREVELARDLDRLLHEHARDAVPADGHAQDVRGRCRDLALGGAEADAAGLAAAAGLHLRLDDDRQPELAGRGLRLRRRERQTRGQDLETGAREQALAPVFEQVHRPTPRRRGGGRAGRPRR